MKKGGSLSYLTKEGFRNVWMNRLMSVASIAVLMACLVMMGSAFMIIVNVQNVMNQIEQQNVIMVYMEDNATAQDVAALQKDILNVDNVLSCEHEDRDQVFQEQLDELGSKADYFEGVENPLPEAFKVTVKDMEKFDSTASALSKLTNVNSIRDNKEIAQILIKTRASVTYISIGIIAVLLIISLFIIANTVRITMYSRRLEISIMKSVGATNWFIRWPFVVEGMALGAFSSVISFGIVWGVYKLLEDTLASMFSVVNADFEIVSFTSYALWIFVAFLVIGIVSGGFGSLVSIQKYLKERGGIVYEEDE